MNVAVSGTGGMLGSALVDRLKSDGNRVMPMVRREASGDEIQWDWMRKEIEAEKFAEVDAVVHLAGENIANGRWTAAKKRRIRDSRVEGTSLLCQALAELDRRPATLIAASAIGYYGDRGDLLCDEDTPPGDGFLPDVCVAWERATDPATESGIRVVNLRIGLVLCATGGALRTMLTPFQMGLGGHVGSGNQYMSWISKADLIGAIGLCLSDDRASGPVNAVAPGPVTNREFTRALARAIHRPAVIPAPALAIQLALGEMAQLLLSSARVVPKKLMALEFPFEHPRLDEALAAIL